MREELIHLARRLERDGFLKDLKKTADKSVSSSYYVKAAHYQNEYANLVGGPSVLYVQLTATALLYLCDETEVERRLKSIKRPEKSNVPRSTLVKMLTGRFRAVASRIEFGNMRLKQQYESELRWKAEVRQTIADGTNALAKDPGPDPDPPKYVELPDEINSLAELEAWVSTLPVYFDWFKLDKEIREIHRVFVKKPGSDDPSIIREAWGQVIVGLVVTE